MALADSQVFPLTGSVKVFGGSEGTLSIGHRTSMNLKQTEQYSSQNRFSSLALPGFENFKEILLDFIIH